MRKLILPGGSGFLGRVLARHFGERGWGVVVLTRLPGKSVASAAHEVHWDGKSLGPWADEFEEVAAVVNLAGRSVNCRYHARNREEIMRSRVDSTRVLGQAIAGCKQPPRVWLNSSTATIYRHSFTPMDEATGAIGGTPEAKDEFSVEVAQAWEQALADAAVPGTRKVDLRTAMVLGDDPDSVYRVLGRLARFGLGGAMGGGKQFVSWIHETDFCRAVEFLIERDDLAGPVNLASPQPLTNREVMSEVRRAFGAKVGLPATRWMLEVGAFLLRTETELVIKSRCVVPRRLLEAGFEFGFPDLRSALAELSEMPRLRAATPPVRAPAALGPTSAKHRAL